jgi:hypothetical protein
VISNSKKRGKYKISRILISITRRKNIHFKFLITLQEQKCKKRRNPPRCQTIAWQKESNHVRGMNSISLVIALMLMDVKYWPNH